MMRFRNVHLVAVIAGVETSGTDAPRQTGQTEGIDLSTSIFLALYFGGRILLVVAAWLGKHLRLPVIGRFAEALAMRRY
jgi:hypothetical protein